MDSKPEIFFSYAWADPGESGPGRDKIVNDLYEALVAAGFNVIRDKNDLRYKGLISDLTQRIGRGKFIVVAISDKYLKSTYCMSELLEIYRRSNSDINEMLKKIFPIVLDDAKIYNPEDRVDYLDYWETKKEQLNEELKAIELENASTFVEELRLYDEITAVIPVLSSLLKDMNTLSIQKLSANNFSEIKDAIIRAASPASIGPAPADKPGTRTRSKLRGWIAPIIVFVVTGLLVLFLHLNHLSTVEITMEVSVSEMNFTLPQQQVVTNILKLSSLGAAGLENIEVPGAVERPQGQPESSASALLLSVDTTVTPPGTITLDALSLPAGMRIGIRCTDVADEYRLSLQGKPLDLSVQVDGRVRLISPPNPPSVSNFTSPTVIRLHSEKEQVDFDLHLQSGPRQIFRGGTIVDSISLLRVDEHHEDEYSSVKTVSTILAGTLQFKNGKKLALLPGQLIQIEKSYGTINKLELSGDLITMSYKGKVSGLTSGEIANRTSLMPTHLEWLNSRVSLSLIGGLILIGLVVIFGFRRFKQTNE